MKLRVFRKEYTDKSTIGDFYIDKDHFAYTLEDTCRAKGVKIAGETAIPEGTYQIILDFSNRFQRDMPHILDVPGFTGIRIHPGNTNANTSGCLLIGFAKGKDEIWDSKAAYNALYERLKAHLSDITIEIC